jgi:DNA-binding Lrp family transcriptional regulator
MDKQDLAILEKLQRDSRMSLTEISNEIGISRFAIRDRVERMFVDHIVLGSTIVVNPLSVGFKRTVFFEFKTNPHEPWLAKLLERLEQCDLVDGITGEYSLFSRFRLADDTHFAQILRKLDDAMGRSYFKKYRAVNAIRIFKEGGTPIEAKKEKTSDLDNVDFKILDILLHQSEYRNTPLPISTVELSHLLQVSGIEISQPAVFSRLIRLKKNMVILRHALRVDYSKLGLHTKFIVRIKVNPNVYDSVAADYLSSMTEISDLYRTGEEYGLLAFLRVKDVSEYNSFLLRLYDSRDIIDTYTTLVLENRKDTPLSLKEEPTRKNST